MVDHHIQKEILARLVDVPRARFVDLKPPEMDGNIFTYHLHQLEKQKLIQKTEDGTYCLTAAGKALGVNINLTGTELSQQAHSILLMAARSINGEWLLRKRLAQPMYGKLGFVHGEPQLDKPVAVTAVERFAEKTGLKADFTVRGSGYIKIFSGGELESFTHFTLLYAEKVSGDLLIESSHGENVWVKDPDFEDNDMIPSMAELVKQLTSTSDLFFCELSSEI